NWLGVPTTAATLAPASAMRTDGNEVYSNGRVYLVDRGLTYADADRYWKVVFVWHSPTAYKLMFGRLNNSYVDSLVLEKNPNETYTYFTFDGGGKSIVMEPKPDEWDFVFTRYRYIFYNTTPYTPYLVSGVLLNPQGIAAGLDTAKVFSEADVAFAQQLPLSTQRDEIGFNWKAYNFATSAYETKQHFTYVIRDREGYYWKLRFLDFYNGQGEKGSPKFEFQRL
ncbi:MAG TPA: HmuY family protein, partial [Chitinophagales bacterium]|nr:HmuY family protein [Chitinophagales bacterium]